MSEQHPFGAPVTFRIGGRPYEGTYGDSLLETLHRYGYEVPSLCHHEAVSAYGACRLCLVEVVDKRGRHKITTSCNFPVQAGIDVLLDTPDVVRHRRVVLELLLAMAPRSPELRALAAEHDVPGGRLEPAESAEDCILCGLMPSELIIIAGRPSMGKTAFGLNIAENMAVQEGIPVGFFSCEMSKDAVSIRLICSRAKVAGDHIKRGTLSEDDKSRLMLADEVLAAAPIYVDDASGMTLMEVRAKARLLVMRQGIRAAFVDYLQLLRCPGQESRLQEVSEVARGLKAMAKELEIPVIAMAQLNRGVEGREDHKPRMSDLRESGSIEQEADVIMLIHRDEYYQQQNTEVQGKAEIIIAKNRNGSIGTVELQYSKQHTRFNNLGF